MKQRKKREQGWYESKPCSLAISNYLLVRQIRREDVLLDSNINPAVLTLTAERIIAALQLHNLQLVLLLGNLSRSEFSHLGGESHEAAIALSISEDAGLEGVTGLLVGEVTDLHLALHTSKSEERPAVLNTDIGGRSSHNTQQTFNLMTKLLCKHGTLVAPTAIQTIFIQTVNLNKLNNICNTQRVSARYR